MIYDNLEEWEVIAKIIADNPAKKNVKQIAAFLGINPSVIYKWQQDPEFSGSPIPKNKILPFSEYTHDNRLLGWYVYQLGYELKEIIPGQSTDGEFMDDLCRLDRWRGVLADLLLDYMRDSKITKKELKDLLEITEKMKKEIDNFQAEIRLKLDKL